MKQANWRTYQDSLRYEHRAKYSFKFAMRFAFAMCLILGAAYASFPFFSQSKNLALKKVTPALPVTFSKTVLSLSELLAQKNPKTELTLSNTMQLQVDRILSQYKLDWAAAAVIDPQTGSILALSSHSEKDPEFSTRAFNAMYPAASVFKVVTSAAAIDKHMLNPDSEISFTGDVRFVGPKAIESLSGSQSMSLEKAFAKSANKVFGRVAAQKLSPELLTEYAQRFGFNQDIPFDVPLSKSEYHLNSTDSLDLAKTGAGFGDVTLSPIHAALMAAAISNSGKMMQPRLIQSQLDDAGRVIYSSSPKLWKQVIPSSTADKMKELMRATIAEGTAKKGFKQKKSDGLDEIDMGGKTGTLTGTIIPAKHEWFMGYASLGDRQLAVGIVIVNDKTWKVKPAYVAKEIFSNYFDQKLEVASKKIAKRAGHS